MSNKFMDMDRLRMMAGAVAGRRLPKSFNQSPAFSKTAHIVRERAGEIKIIGKSEVDQDADQVLNCLDDLTKASRYGARQVRDGKDNDDKDKG